MDLSREQGAKSLELRAVVSLSGLWQKQGRSEEGRQMLQAVYGWFTEAFDTADLKQANKLLNAFPSEPQNNVRNGD
jgi:predicted ATPase